MFASVIAGLGLGFSLIIAIGAQNLFVLQQGLRRRHVGVTAAICAVSDAALIVVGVSGIGAILHTMPWLVDAARWGGAAFLIGYGLLAARRALRRSGSALSAEQSRPVDQRPGVAEGDGGTATAVAVRTEAATSRLVSVVLTCLALTWLNPHVYLDTVFLLGTVANTHGDNRWWFAAGAVVASLLWFFGLGYGARLLSGVLATTRAWRILDALIALVMICLGIGLVAAR